ncbi:Protein OS-9-like protein [Lasiodiplodia hormozganensis]|uniref:Endoplasmic reticulum lectin n=1 Tax=Lasiodiplodia hormozganensis TaxID=869390 RepID=A0AA39YDG1_9PEZI|nr:Protein OS-9-like protein [Lasiodiplodia hormozganensis]
MTRHFWALPAIAQLVLASQGSFSVLDDLLAFPQYQVVFTDAAISEDHARSLHAASPSKQQPIADAAAQATVELSHHRQEGDDNTNGDKLFRGDNAPPQPNPFAAKDPNSHLGGDNDDDDDEFAAVYERMMLNSQPYLCRIPLVDTSATNNASSANGTTSEADEEKELARASDRGWELLKGMQGNCIYFLSGWWSYSFCYNDSVKQFHQLPPSRGVPIYPPVEDESVSSFILGTFPKENENGKKGEEGAKESESGASSADVDDEGMPVGGKEREETGVARLETKGETRYLVQKLTGGTTCDLTGKQRKIEVQFHCHPNTPDRIGMIKEVATCSYLMVIYTPRLCNDVAFLPPQENRAHPVSCAPILSSGAAAVPSITPRRKSNPMHIIPTEDASAETGIDLPDALKYADAAAGGDPTQQQPTSKPLPTIGGIVVGAQQLVGKPGSVIEKSVVVGGGKETLLGIVAESPGGGRPHKMMSTEELKALKINDKEEVERLRKQLSKLAGRKPWRLELVDTPRGKEFRGIIENDEGEDREDGEGRKDGGEEGMDQQQGTENGGGGENGGYDEGEWEDIWEWQWLDDPEGQWGDDMGEDGGQFEEDEGADRQEGSEEVYHEDL